jgi:hypothetical protein
MEAIKPPKTLKYYQLIRMSTKTGLNISSCGAAPAGGANYIGHGMFTTLQEAEHNRTIELLKDTDAAFNTYHVFELEFPNPAYRE